MMKIHSNNSHLSRTFSKVITIAILTSYAYSSHSLANNQTASVVAGKTLLAKGQVNAINTTTDDSRVLRRRSNIFSVENIVTGANSKAQFSMSDGGLITLKENTKISINNYVFNKESQQGSATLEIISGGLRSISGLIKKSGGDYQIKTPVGSIGIRGTHFSVDVIGENVLFGVYSGNIDVTLATNEILSLGTSESYSFASVNELGDITLLTQAPEELALGYSTSSNPNSSTESSSTTVSSEAYSTATAEPEPLTVVANLAVNSQLYAESEWQGVSNASLAELISERTGTFDYQQVLQSNVTSSVGSVQDFSMNLAINFDNATVPGGSLSFTDAQGEWFATYSGLINVEQLALGINFASHANQKVEGDISAAFSNGLDEITGRFDLHEIENPTIQANGSFKIK